jgi:thiosulfate reductase cytochrome b subunit
MKRVVIKHPLAIRWFHWLNFPILAVMIWSGMLIYWSNDVYRLGWGNATLLKFFPDTFYKALHIPYRLAEGMSLHFVFMWLFAINGIIYVLFLIFSGEWRLIVPNKKSIKESWLVILHDLHLRKGLPPQKKYNAAQRIAYTGVILMGLGSLLTGLAIFKPVQFNILVAMLGGYEWARIEHFILTILFTLFFVVHILQVILAGWNNFRSMVIGLDVLPPLFIACTDTWDVLPPLVLANPDTLDVLPPIVTNDPDTVTKDPDTLDVLPPLITTDPNTFTTTDTDTESISPTTESNEP